MKRKPGFRHVSGPLLEVLVELARKQVAPGRLDDAKRRLRDRLRRRGRTEQEIIEEMIRIRPVSLTVP